MTQSTDRATDLPGEKMLGNLMLEIPERGEEVEIQSDTESMLPACVCCSCRWLAPLYMLPPRLLPRLSPATVIP